MYITRSRISSLPLLLIGVLVFGTPSALVAETVLLPIVAGVEGANGALWQSEVRITNRSDVPKQFSVVDWIGTSLWKASAYTVPPHSTTSVGGADISGRLYGSAYGLAICDADADLLVQAAILVGAAGPGVGEGCPSFDGGGFVCQGQSGAGPIVDGLSFASPAQEVFVPWLHTASDRRTNLVLINPDDIPAHVTVAVTSQDGTAAVTADYVLPSRSYNQINDLFSQDQWSAIRSANAALRGAGASATMVSDTRLLAMAYVISNNNNSLTISLPR